MINPELKERAFEKFILNLETELNSKVEYDAWREHGRKIRYDIILASGFFLTGMFWRTLFDWIF